MGPNGVVTMEQIDEVLGKIREPRSKNPRVTYVGILAQQRARNGGYPLDMHHPTLEPRQVFNEDQKEALEQRGYSETYRHRDYPRMLYRRNLEADWQSNDQRWAMPQQTDKPLEPENRVEYRVVKTVEDEAALLKQRVSRGCTAWTEFSKIEPLPDGPTEDPAVTIARLEGEKAGMLARMQESDPAPLKAPIRR